MSDLRGRMTTEDWISRELAKRPPRSEAFKEETRGLWGLKSRSLGGPVDLNARGVEPNATSGPVDDDGPDVAA